VTFGAWKAGTFLPPASYAAGQLRFVDVGLPTMTAEPTFICFSSLRRRLQRCNWVRMLRLWSVSSRSAAARVWAVGAFQRVMDWGKYCLYRTKCRR
jgi:hypothetical protein